METETGSGRARGRGRVEGRKRGRGRGRGRGEGRTRDLRQEGASIIQSKVGSHFGIASALELLAQRLLIQPRRRGGVRGSGGGSQGSFCGQEPVVQRKLVSRHQLQFALHLPNALQQLGFPGLLARLRSFLLLACRPRHRVMREACFATCTHAGQQRHATTSREGEQGLAGKRQPRTMS